MSVLGISAALGVSSSQTATDMVARPSGFVDQETAAGRLCDLARGVYGSRSAIVAASSLLSLAQRNRSIDLWETLIDVVDKNAETAEALRPRLGRANIQYVQDYYQNEAGLHPVAWVTSPGWRLFSFDESTLESFGSYPGPIHREDGEGYGLMINQNERWIHVAARLALDFDNATAAEVVGGFVWAEQCANTSTAQALMETDWLNLCGVMAKWRFGRHEGQYSRGVGDSVLKEMQQMGLIRAGLHSMSTPLVKQAKRGNAQALRALCRLQELDHFRKVILKHRKTILKAFQFGRSPNQNDRRLQRVLSEISEMRI